MGVGRTSLVQSAHGWQKTASRRAQGGTGVSPEDVQTMKTIAIVPGALALAIANCLAIAAPADDAAQPDQNQVAQADQGAPTELPKVEVRERNRDDTRPKLQHIMKEVDGPLITVTKKTS